MKYINIIVVALLVIMASCQDRFIDLDPQDAYTEAVYYNAPEHFEFAANQLHHNLVGWAAIRGSGLANGFNTSYGDWMDFGSDLGALPQDEARGANLLTVTDSYWSNHYYFNRDANTLIEKGVEYSGDQEEIIPYIATGYFFRAYHHFELLQRFGGVPIVLNTLELNEELLATGKRNSRYEVVAQILSDLDVAIEGLPIEQEIAAADRGKISRWGAEALKARVLLYEATWERYVGTTTDGDGTTNGAGSAMPEGYPSVNDMLTEAIELASDVMDNGGYELWNHNDGLDNLSSYHLFNLDGAGSNPMGLDKSSNKEFIIQGVYDFEIRQGGQQISHTVGGRLAPSRKMLDLFVCTDGLPIDKSPLFQGYATVSDELINRDYRMNAYFSEIPEGGSPVLTGQGLTNAGVGIRNRKHEAFDYQVYRQANEESQNFPYLRLAEVYLIYAEAMIERDGTVSDADLDRSVNMIRERAGIAPLNSTLISSGSLDLKEEIRRERTIEMYGENSRYDDLKRWGIAEEVLGATVYGPIIEGTVYETDAALYDPALYPHGEAPVENGTGALLSAIVLDPSSLRNFNRQHYLFPIPTGEILIATDLLQNPGW